MRKLLFAVAFVFSSIQTRAAEHWIRVSTPHFEMYTTNGEKQAIGALQVFEQVRYFFMEKSPSKTAPNDVVRIIAFRSEKEYKPYKPNEGAFAYYLPSRKGDMIVMQDISSEHHQAAVHEYTHLIIKHLGLKFPIFLNEGLADLYSSLEPYGSKAMIGRPLEGRGALLKTQPWLDLNTLFAVDRDSPYYNESAKMSIFYAESWALVHMLALGKDYEANFPKFQAAVNGGRPVAECFQTIYGKSVAQVTKELQAYVNQSAVRAALFDVKLSKMELEPEVSEASELSVNLALADLLAAQKRTSQEAEERLTQLASAHPESAEVQESIGYLAWSQGESQKALQSFKLAQAKGSKNVPMLLDYAALLESSGNSEDALSVLDTAVTMKPDDQTTWFSLGMIATSAGKCSTALNAWAHVKSVKPDQAYSLFSAKAYCYLRLKSADLARQDAEKAKGYAKTPAEQLQVTTFLQDVDLYEHNQKQGIAGPARVITNPTQQPDAATDVPDKPTLRHSAPHELPRDVPSVGSAENLQHVEAVAKSLDCNSKVRHLHVLVNSKEMIFELTPEDVIVRNGNQKTVDMQCGPQKPYKVGIFYIPLAQPASADGSISEMVF